MVLNDKLTHGVSTAYIQDILINIMRKSDDCAWTLDYLSRIIFKNQEIRKSHNAAILEILRLNNLPSGWLLLSSKVGPADPILYNINNKESCKMGDFLLMRSNRSNIYKNVFPDFNDYENKLRKQIKIFLYDRSINSDSTINNPEYEKLNTNSDFRKADNQKSFQSLIDSIDDL
jgi:hypothetical protein